MEIGREDLSLAKLAEAHWDAVAILAEASRLPVPGAVYAVWASEGSHEPLRLEPTAEGFRLSGKKMFCSGAGLVDCALITVRAPDERLIDVDLRESTETTSVDYSSWKTEAFRLTQTGTVSFDAKPLPLGAIVGEPGWYVNRPGFWHGACGPAACWAGGVAGLLDFALGSSRSDPHTMAHLGAVHADIWGMQALLDAAGAEIDREPFDSSAAQVRALQVRHLVEQACTDVLRRFARAYGPAPLALNSDTARRYQEADLYVRQSHAERDLESLGRQVAGVTSPRGRE